MECPWRHGRLLGLYRIHVIAQQHIRLYYVSENTFRRRSWLALHNIATIQA